MIKDAKPELLSPGAKVLPLHARSTTGDLKPSEMRGSGPREFLVPALGIQSRGRPCIILGLPGSRKGFFTMSLQVAMAAGGDFLGECFPGGSPSAYWDWDQTVEETGERWAPLAKGYGIRLDELDRFVSYAWRPVHTMAPTNESDYERAVSELSRRAERLRFVIVDSVSKACPGVRENSPEASIPFAIMADVTARTGVTFVATDHPGWEGRRQRGHSSKEASSGTILRLEKPAPRSAITNVDCYRNQGVDPSRLFAPFAFSLAPRNGGLVLAREKTSPAPVFSPAALEDMKTVLLKCIVTHPGHSKRGVQAMVRGDDKLKRAGLEELETDGLIANRGSRGKGRLFPKPVRSPAFTHRTLQRTQNRPVGAKSAVKVG